MLVLFIVHLSVVYLFAFRLDFYTNLSVIDGGFISDILRIRAITFLIRT